MESQNKEQEQQQQEEWDEEEHKMIVETVNRMDNLHMYLSMALLAIMDRVMDSTGGDDYVRLEIFAACLTVIDRLHDIHAEALETFTRGLCIQCCGPSSPPSSPAE